MSLLFSPWYFRFVYPLQRRNQNVSVLNLLRFCPRGQPLSVFLQRCDVLRAGWSTPYLVGSKAVPFGVAGISPGCNLAPVPRIFVSEGWVGGILELSYLDDAMMLAQFLPVW